MHFRMPQTKISHRDIKPCNTLVKEQRVFSVDFGLVKDFTFEGQSQLPNDANCGTPVYLAPEIRKNIRDRATDVFALAYVSSEMLTMHSASTLKEYQKCRKVVGSRDSEDDVPPFRANLPMVNLWLKQLRQSSSFDKFIGILV